MNKFKSYGPIAEPIVDRPAARKCFICGFVGRSPDKEPPFRCDSCYVRVAMNEADGEL